MKFSFAVLLSFLPFCAFTQTGGINTFDFLQLPVSARSNALGGNQFSWDSTDISLGIENPAAYNPAMNRKMAFNTSIYPGGINHGYAAYSWNNQKLKTSFGAGIQYVAYGNFEQTDESGRVIGNFSASEYMLHSGAARQYGPFRYGTNMKIIYSQLESYNSFGFAVDFGGLYIDSSKNLALGISVLNLGYQLFTYTPGTRESLPFDIRIALSKKLEHVPFRFDVVVHHLYTWDIRYNDPNQSNPTNIFGIDTLNTIKPKTYFADKLARHFIFGGELILGPSLKIRMGYNHQRRMEFSENIRRSWAGFSFGAGIRIAHVNIDYSLASYNVAGTAHMFSLSTNLNTFLPKERY